MHIAHDQSCSQNVSTSQLFITTPENYLSAYFTDYIFQSSNMWRTENNKEILSDHYDETLPHVWADSQPYADILLAINVCDI